MAAGNELGLTFNQPYAGWAYFITTAQYTEVSKFLPIVTSVWPRLRIISSFGTDAGGIVWPNNATTSAHIWAAAVKAYSPSTYILYGTTNNQSTVTGSPELSCFIPSAYSTYRGWLLQEAQWAQDNLMDAFSMGNENLILAANNNVGMPPLSLIRTSNVVTATFSYPHGLTTGDYIFVADSDASFNVANTEGGETGVQCTVTSSTTMTYPKTGGDGAESVCNPITTFQASAVSPTTKTQVNSTSHGFTNGQTVYILNTSVYNGTYTISNVATNNFDITKVFTVDNSGGIVTRVRVNWSAYEVVRKTKALAVECQAIFTRGPIQYSEAQGHFAPWIALGITPGTDIDLIGLNGYGSGTGDATRRAYWKNEVDTDWAAFGTNLIITEHNVVQDSGDEEVGGLNHGEEGFEVVADAEIIWRYEYARILGITQIYLFSTDEYKIFCNTWPSTTYDNAYLVGDWKPIVDAIRGLPVSRVFFGTNNLT